MIRTSLSLIVRSLTLADILGVAVPQWSYSHIRATSNQVDGTQRDLNRDDLKIFWPMTAPLPDHTKQSDDRGSDEGYP